MAFLNGLVRFVGFLLLAVVGTKVGAEIGAAIARTTSFSPATKGFLSGGAAVVGLVLGGSVGLLLLREQRR